MPKKKSLKASSSMKDGSACQKETPMSSSKKGDEIDAIFASRKRKMAEQEKAERTSATNEKLKKAKKKKRRNPEESKAFNPDAKPRRRTSDGLTIYSEEDLGINRQDAGSTALCPFDCSCCF